MKSIHISVRISPEEADFLARYSVSGAITPSEKLRHIINDARNRETKPKDCQSASKLVDNWLNPSIEAIANAEHDVHKQSALLVTYHNWLRRGLIALVLHSGKLDQSASSLKAYEEASLELLVNLSDQLLRMLIPPVSQLPRS